MWHVACGMWHVACGVWHAARTCIWEQINASGIKVKLKFALEQATKPQRGSRDIALLFP
jgi:hypothetical protein